MLTLFTRQTKALQAHRTHREMWEWDDAKLCAHYRKKEDQQAVAILLDRYADLISIISLRYLQNEEEVRDFAMDLYLHLVQKLKTCEVENFRNWLAHIVTNRLKDILRKKKVRVDYKKKVVSKGNSPQEKMDQDLSVKLDLGLLKSALKRLSPRERESVEALYFQQLSYEEASELLGISVTQLRGTRDRAITKLRNWLGGTLGKYFQDLA